MASKQFGLKFSLRILLISFFALGIWGCDCGDDGSSEPRVQSDESVTVVKLPGDNRELLPFAVFFKKNGDPLPVSFNSKGGYEEPLDTSDEKFPVQGKIRRVESFAMVFYEASCDVLVKTKKGYKTMTIHDDSICEAIQP
ncbi:MAG: hypothetical protein VYA55_10505 [Pseudomonadota bacterium]|nr:hypothetical protein [Pseudomonadota bacterium]